MGEQKKGERAGFAGVAVRETLLLILPANFFYFSKMLAYLSYSSFSLHELMETFPCKDIEKKTG